LYSLVYFIRRSLFIVLALVSITTNAQKGRFSYTDQKMGSPFNIIFFTQDSSFANQQAKACFKLVDSLNHIFSNYDATSELSIMNQNAGLRPTTVSTLMWELLLASKQAYLKSKGSFNISLGPLTLLWRNARHSKQFPSKQQIQSNLLLCQFNTIQFNEHEQSIYLPKKGMQLDFGGIAKGYIAQKVIDFLKTKGVHEALVEAGGDISIGDAPPTKLGWVVGVNEPEQAEQLLQKKLQLHNLSVATSGDVYQFIEHNGLKYSHILNPATGLGVTTLRNVTVIAQDGAIADWLATACSILPIQEAKKLAQSQKAELLITEMVHDELKYFTTKGFNRFWYNKN